MQAVFSRPRVDEVIALARCRIYLVANPLDNLWRGKKRFSNRAFMPNHENPIHTVSVLEDHALTYWPKHSVDWKESDLAWRTMEFIYYDFREHRGGAQLVIRQRPTDRLFLRVHSDWRKALQNGKRTHQDLYATLWRER